MGVDTPRRCMLELTMAQVMPQAQELFAVVKLLRWSMLEVPLSHRIQQNQVEAELERVFRVAQTSKS